MIRTTLDAVNHVLRALGEPPLNSLDTQYPTLDLILPALEQNRIDLLTEGWWFNVLERSTLSPDPSGVVFVPADTLDFYPDDPAYVFAGTYISLKDGETNIGRSVRGRRIVDREFDRLPQAARTYIANAAIMDVYISDVGVDTIAQAASEQAHESYQVLGGMHTRQRKFSMRQSPSVQEWRRMLRR